MRIIAGRHKGRKLVAAGGDWMRPTTDRVKTHIFDKIGDVSGASVLDLFAGTGALGIESISRGAKRVVFVEKEKRSLEIIRKNLQLIGNPEQATIMRADALHYMKFAGKDELKFDVVFADPPYNYYGTDLLIEAVMEGSLLTTQGIFVYERRGGAGITTVAGNDVIMEEKKMGSTSIMYFQKTGESV
jgi:16S rRNA (guanine966-N2)-methyltransferase